MHSSKSLTEDGYHFYRGTFLIEQKIAKQFLTEQSEKTRKTAKNFNFKECRKRILLRAKFN